MAEGQAALQEQEFERLQKGVERLRHVEQLWQMQTTQFSQLPAQQPIRWNAPARTPKSSRNGPCWSYGGPHYARDCSHKQHVMVSETDLKECWSCGATDHFSMSFPNKPDVPQPSQEVQVEYLPDWMQRSIISKVQRGTGDKWVAEHRIFMLPSVDANVIACLTLDTDWATIGRVD